MEAVASGWTTAVGWSDYVDRQESARAMAGRDPEAAQLLGALSPAMSRRDEEELIHSAREAEEQLRRLVGSVGGVDLVATALRLHRQERSLLHDPLLSPDEIFLRIAQGRAHAIKALRAAQ